MTTETSIIFDHLVKKTWSKIALKQIKDDWLVLHYHNDRVIGVMMNGEGGLKGATEYLFNDDCIVEEICFLLIRSFSVPTEKDIKPFNMVIVHVPENVTRYDYYHFGARFHVGEILEEINYFNFYFFESNTRNDLEPSTILRRIRNEFGRSLKKKKRSSVKLDINEMITSNHQNRILFDGVLIKEGGGTFSFNTKKRYHSLRADLKMRYFDKKGGKLKGMYSIEGTRIGRGMPPNRKKKKTSIGAIVHQIKGGRSVDQPKKRKKKSPKKSMTFAEKRRTVLDEHRYLQKERERILSCTFFIETKSRCFVMNSKDPEITNSWLEVLQICGGKREDFFIGDDDIKIDIKNNNDVYVVEDNNDNDDDDLGGEMIDLVNQSLRNVQRRESKKKRSNTFNSLLNFSSAMMKKKLDLRRKKRKMREIRIFLRLCGDEIEAEEEEDGEEDEEAFMTPSPEKKKDMFFPDSGEEGKYKVLEALKRTLGKVKVGIEDLFVMDSRSRQKLRSLFLDFLEDQNNNNEEEEEEEEDQEKCTKGRKELTDLIVSNYEKVEVIIIDPTEVGEEEEEEGEEDPSSEEGSSDSSSSGEEEEEKNKNKKKRSTIMRKKNMEKRKMLRRKRRRKGWDVESIGKISSGSPSTNSIDNNMMSDLDLLLTYARSILNNTIFMDACYTCNVEVLKILLMESNSSKNNKVDVNFKLKDEKSENSRGDTGLHRLGRAEVKLKDKKDVLTFLLSQGADPHMKNDRGETFVDLVKGSEPELANIVESFFLMDDF